jgi:hypothetical protein
MELYVPLCRSKLHLGSSGGYAKLLAPAGWTL